MSVTERQLIIVTDVFLVQGRATCLLPVVPQQLTEAASGVQLQTTLRALEWLRPSKGGLVISLEPTVSKGDVPVGTEVWKVEPQ
jgi:hypothetical protein